MVDTKWTVGRIVHTDRHEAAIIIASYLDEYGPGAVGCNLVGWHMDGSPFTQFSTPEGTGAGTFHDPRTCADG